MLVALYLCANFFSLLDIVVQSRRKKKLNYTKMTQNEMEQDKTGTKERESFAHFCMPCMHVRFIALHIFFPVNCQFLSNFFASNSDKRE